MPESWPKRYERTRQASEHVALFVHQLEDPALRMKLEVAIRELVEAVATDVHEEACIHRLAVASLLGSIFPPP